MMVLPRPKPWWCDCKTGGGYDDPHDPDCYGNQEAFPKLTAALDRLDEKRRAG